MTPERYEQIGDLYQAALEREPAGRAAFLAEACGADETLHGEVVSFLAAHEKASDFIEQPPHDVAAGWQAASPAPKQAFGRYRLLSLLGKGGMGEVWLAEDTQLRRKVAIKLLPAEFTTDAGRVRRFAQEARAASALNHPNILTIHEIGENEDTHYLVTEYVEGETLRERITGTPNKRLHLNEAVAVAAQIAEALTAAHEAGIVHRDIKPENVMVRKDGYIKVLDFGLAKLTEPTTPDPQAPTLASLTAPGMVMGTPRYMSPEQARGEKVDSRTDIFSLGAMLYEMIAGHAPFVGATPSEVIAAILRDDPLSLTADEPQTPPELQRMIHRSLQKNRDERYQTAHELLADLKRLRHQLERPEGEQDELMQLRQPAKNERPSSDPAFTLSQQHSTDQLTQAQASRNRWNRGKWLLGCVSGVIFIAVAAWFYFHLPPVLTAKDSILLADFENKTGDEIFDELLKQGLAIQLQQSPFLNLFPGERVRQTLRLMGRSPESRVTAEIAREICERQNLKALIAGSIARLGGHYVIMLEALNGQNSESLAQAQIEVESKEQVLQALSQAAVQLRLKLGESLSLIQRFDKPLEVATTSKLDALKAFSQAQGHATRGRFQQAIPLLKHAVELDPEFARAYALLGVLHFNLKQFQLSAEYSEKAYELRDRVNEYEKFQIVNYYYIYASGELDKRMEAQEAMKQTYPRDWVAPLTQARTNNQIGKFDQAVATARESLHLNPDFAAAYRELGLASIRLNRFAEGREVYERALQQKLDMPDFHAGLFEMAFVQGDTAEMERQIEAVRGKPEEHVTFNWQAGAAASAGQWRKAQTFARGAIELTATGDTKEVAAQYATEQALRGAVVGVYAQSKLDAKQGLQFARGRVSLPRAALAFALCGDVKQAQPLLAELHQRYPQDVLINELWLPVIRAAIELQAGNAAQAIAQLQPASRYEAAAEFWPQYLRGQAYLKLNKATEAASEFQKILNARGQAALSVLYPLAQLGLAHAAQQSGDRIKAREAYEMFFVLWKEADPDLPTLLAAKKEYERVK